ncbi:MAG: hypothetical protein CK532_02470 [Flavobacteriales bacterium]|nr:MAG: hypothetical protein CK532_02470 [Flavobacteriales bacterium]
MTNCTTFALLSNYIKHYLGQIKVLSGGFKLSNSPRSQVTGIGYWVLGLKGFCIHHTTLYVYISSEYTYAFGFNKKLIKSK